MNEGILGVQVVQRRREDHDWSFHACEKRWQRRDLLRAVSERWPMVAVVVRKGPEGEMGSGRRGMQRRRSGKLEFEIVLTIVWIPRYMSACEAFKRAGTETIARQDAPRAAMSRVVARRLSSRREVKRPEAPEEAECREFGGGSVRK